MATYLVTQATGGQSQWTITHLLAAGVKVHAVVRDLQKIPLSLKHPGITLFQGSLEDSQALFRAAQGCKGVFLNTYPSYVDVEAEGRQAKTVLDSCKKAGVETVVASTTICTGNRGLWDDPQCMLRGYYHSKAKVEEVVRGAGFKTYTIVRPAFIHHNYLHTHTSPNFPGLPKGVLDHAFTDGVRMPQIDANDIGRYAAAALLDPAKFGKQEIELSNEHLTVEEVRDVLVKVSGRDVRVRKRTPAEIEEAKLTVPAQAFHIWANENTLPDTAKATEEKFGIPFTPFETAMRREKSLLLETLPAQE